MPWTALRSFAWWRKSIQIRRKKPPLDLDKFDKSILRVIKVEEKQLFS